MDILPFTQQQQRLVPSSLPDLLRRIGEELRCPICLDTLTDPHAGASCSHSYCNSCLQRMLRSSKKTTVPCPMCKTAPIARRSIKRQPKFDEIIRSFKELTSSYWEDTGIAWDEESVIVSDADGDDYPVNSIVDTDCPVDSSSDSFIFTNPKPTIATTTINITNPTLTPTTPVKPATRMIDETPFKTPSTVKFASHKSPFKSPIIIANTPTKIQIEQLQEDQRNLSQKIRNINNILLLDESDHDSMDEFDIPTIDFPSSLSDRLFSLPLLPPSDYQNQQKPVRIGYSLLKQGSSEMRKLMELVTRNNEYFQITEDPSQATHFVTLSSPNNSSLTKKRTIKYCRAVLGGAWILSFEWVLALLEKEDFSFTDGQNFSFLEESFSLLGDPYTAVISSTSNTNRTTGKNLFNGLVFFLYGVHLSPSFKDLSLLITEGGGVCVIDVADVPPSSPSPSNNRNRNNNNNSKKKKTIVLCDSSVNGSYEKDSFILQRFRPFISSIWVLDCISERCLLDHTASEYVIL